MFHLVLLVLISAGRSTQEVSGGSFGWVSVTVLCKTRFVVQGHTHLRAYGNVWEVGVVSYLRAVNSSIISSDWIRYYEVEFGGRKYMDGSVAGFSL